MNTNRWVLGDQAAGPEGQDPRHAAVIRGQHNAVPLVKQGSQLPDPPEIRAGDAGLPSQNRRHHRSHHPRPPRPFVGRDEPIARTGVDQRSHWTKSEASDSMSSNPNDRAGRSGWTGHRFLLKAPERAGVRRG